MTLQAATINVTPGTGTLKAAITNAAAGDVLVLTNGTYTESSTLSLTVPLTICAAENTSPVLALAKRIELKADFTLRGVTVQSTTDVLRVVAGNALCDVTIDNCLFLLGGSAANTARAIYANDVPQQLRNISITNCTFDGGTYGTGRFIYLYGGNDVTPIAGTAIIDHCTFYNSTDTRGVYPANIDKCHITNCIFMNPEERDNTNSFAVYGSNSYVHNCLAYNAPVKVGTGGSQADCITRNPYFVDPENANFRLFANSPAVNAGTDGSTLGDPRWGVSDETYDNSNDPYIPYKQPYSMAPTTNSVKILWQMNDETEPTDALVYYGTHPDSLNMQIQTNSGWNVADEGFVHVVTLTNLQPNTRYYFTVGASSTRRYDKISSTKTAPEQGTAFRIFTISDIHGNARNNWSNMQDFICNLNCDIALMNGDFVSSKGNDRNWNNYYFKPGEPFLSQVPCMSSPGNHETGDPFTYRWSSFYDYFHQFSHDGPSEGDTIDPRGESYFHFVYGNMDVVVLNLNGDPSSPDFLPGSKQYHWADSVLGTCTRPWILICHHVGVHTTGYHGQWADEPRQMGALFEKHAALGKRIISLSGDDHSFEHLYKDGVHYVRPGCGRDANYDQQKQLNDYRYSMFYRRVSCFSTLDVSADAAQISLTAYDSVGNPFYHYDFLREGEVITPAVHFTVPAVEVNAEDSIQLRWFTFDPVGDASVSFYYSTIPDAVTVDGMTPLVTNLSGSVEKYMWHTRNIYPKGKYYIYAVVTSGGESYMGGNTAVVNLLEDLTPPPAPSGLTGRQENGKYRLTWSNPTHLVHLDNLLTDFNNGIDGIQNMNDDGATMAVQMTDGALQCNYTITTAWATASADYVFDAATDLSQTPILTFRLKGNGSSTDLRIVCKNMSDGHEDWWYTERFNLSNAAWKEVTLDMRTLQAFDWYANTDDRNRCEGLVRLSFGVSTGNAVSGTFYLDDLRLSGDIYPAPDYAQTVIVRKDTGFPSSYTDGTEVYRGTEETCVDGSAIAGQVYYYAAFAADDRNNWSAPDADAQWKSGTAEEGVEKIHSSGTGYQKTLRNGMLFIRHGASVYTVLGQIAK